MQRINMAENKNDVFWQEKSQLDEFRRLIEQDTSGKIDQKDFSKLLQQYSRMLKQFEILTLSSDKYQSHLKQLQDKLKRYVSPPLYKKITSGKETVEINKTKRMKLSIFFSDIINFSSHSRDMEGESLSAFLNSYLEEMTIIANDYGGTLDKYIGDAIMVFFVDPVFVSDQDHALRCVRMAVAMRQRLRELHQHWFDLGYANPLHVRMGISTGFVSVGNFGSSERLDYTIIGTPVNLASRIQGVAGDDQILISHPTWSLVKDEIPCSEAFSVNLKGFEHGQLVHEVLLDDLAIAHIPKLIEEPDLGFCLRWNEAKLSLEEIIKILSER